MDALDGADALAIMTEWGDYQRPDFNEMCQRMQSPVIFDGRNLYEPWSHGAARLHVPQHRPPGGGVEVPRPSGATCAGGSAAATPDFR